MAGETSVFIERLPWPEIEARIAGGSRRAVICAASSEQHGPHLPEATDALLGAALAERVAHKLGDALVAPVIRPGCSDHHMAFAGSLTISPRLLMDTLDAYVEGLRRHGFEAFFVFSSHGGNFSVLEEWARARPQPGVTVVSDLMGFMGALVAVAERHGRHDGRVLHADLCETSMMLRVHPELVRMDRAQPGCAGDLEPALVFAGIRELTPNGVIGNPLGASPEMGEEMLEALSGWLVEQARQARPDTPPLYSTHS